MSPLYEEDLAKRGLSDAVIAYRKLQTPDGRGMCSIDFAKEAFEKIASYDNCIAMALDVSNYFESLDHVAIRGKWCNLLGETSLKSDHFKVFKSITRYSQIDRDEVYKRLGILVSDAALGRFVYTKKKNEISTKLCSINDFREKICKPPGAIWTNANPYGIPQGSPISDLIANFYLLDFDQTMSAFVQTINGFYRRYCDDILVIYSDTRVGWETVEAFVESEIGKCGSHIEIKSDKTCVHAFAKGGSDRCKSLKGDEKHFEYLGFQFDGVEARFRDRTVSSFYRKLKWAIYSEARSLVRKYPGKPLSFIEGKFDVSELLQKFGRRRGFADCGDVHQWTFWTYAKRSTAIMGPFGNHLFRQIANYRRFVRHHSSAALVEAYAKRK